MEPKYLYTIRWTQPYATNYLRPYLRQLHEQMEKVIEYNLEHNDFKEAKSVIERIKAM
jgi:hypothetical protein